MALTINQGDSSSPSTDPWDYDVFLIFRGKDTRNGFTSHLYRALWGKNIKTFMDNDLDRGEIISVKLVECIKSSMITIIIFSENFAFSSCCLDELVESLKCKQNGQLVMPVFFKVLPSDVYEQKGNFEVALAEQQNKFKHSIEKVQRWRAALREVANDSGWHYEDNGPEYKFIQRIIASVLCIKFFIKAIKSLLDIEAINFRVVGFHCSRGIRRRTIVEAVYKEIAKHFEESSFLENVRENSRTSDGIIQLQKKLLSDISGGKHLNVVSVAHGTDMIRKRLQRKRVLLILCDVDEPNQIQKLIGSCDWFVSRSRVLIITRDENVLATLGKVCTTHKVEELDIREALELFVQHAFGGKKLDEDYFEVAGQVIKDAKGLQLALKIVDFDLCGRTKSEWEDAIRQYGEFDERVHKKLSKL